MKLVFVAVFCAIFVISEIEAGYKCPEYCNNYYDPVCGTRGNEYYRFDNMCRMDLFNCNLPAGEAKYSLSDCKVCDERDKRRCEIQVKCSSDGPEVCVTNGYQQVTYPNLCQMKTFTCDKYEWAFISNGKCRSKQY